MTTLWTTDHIYVRNKNDVHEEQFMLTNWNKITINLGQELYHLSNESHLHEEPNFSGRGTNLIYWRNKILDQLELKNH